MLDARGGEPNERRLSYRPKLVEGLDDVSVDVVLASVRHYQLSELLPLLAHAVPDAELLFFDNLWTSFELVDAQLRGATYGCFRLRAAASRMVCLRGRCSRLCSLGSCLAPIGRDSIR